MHDRISDTRDSGKNFWKELRNLGLISKASEGFKFTMVSEADEILAVSHFKSQVRGRMAYHTA